MADTTVPVVLEDFEGKPVVGVVAEVRGVDGGLNRGMALEPIVHIGGDRAFIAFEVELRSIRHDPTKKGENSGPQNRVQIYDAEKAIILEGVLLDSIAAALDAQHDRIVAHEEAVEREQATLLEKARAEAKAEQSKQKARDAGQGSIEDEVGTEHVGLPENRPGQPGNTAAGKGDEVKAKRDEKVATSAAATRAAGRDVTPRPKKATTARKTPAKKAAKRTRKATH